MTNYLKRFNFTEKNNLLPLIIECLDSTDNNMVANGLKVIKETLRQT